MTPTKNCPPEKQFSLNSMSPGQVMVPNAVLSEVMEMMPVESIKIEAEERTENASLSELLQEMEVTRTDDEDKSYPQMEGKEEDEEDVTKSDPVTSYLSMNNSRNYVCNDCDAGFTFIRSYNWHRSRCKGKTLGKVCPPSPSKKPSLPSTSNTTTQAMVVCKICQASVTGLKSHLSLVHFKTQLLEQFSSSPRKCKLCSKKFKSIHSLILHIGIHHGMVRKLSSNSKSILKRKIINSSSSNTKLKVDPESPTKSKDSKEKNSLYKASLMKKKLANGPETNNAINISDSNKQSPKKQVKLEEAFVDGRPGTSSTPTPSSGRKVPCGVCVKCQLPDCGSCPQCVGGGAKGVQKICVKKVCRNKIWSTE